MLRAVFSGVAKLLNHGFVVTTLSTSDAHANGEAFRWQSGSMTALGVARRRLQQSNGRERGRFGGGRLQH
jgi:hypothetical protein